MNDCIKLKDLTFQACHGALPHERRIAQEFRVDVTLWTSLDRAGKSDRLEDTLSYADVADVVAAVMSGPVHNLLESLANDIASQILSRFSVTKVGVTVKKMAPPLKMPSGPAQVEIERHG
ncbi:MAG: dihydroneopterin aldolase [Sulfobacillus benefaciens]|uniref:7,8-dihydroneopterin aldolase n=1 Tax=Sulfobacillus benefaciens TaxID=453960 RepID=A0A2T2XD59_9FIRM|nr:MAG: dihydroneopterin aldolase [Sulfobacillus benefaciens]